MPASSECSKVRNSIRTPCLCTWQGRLRTLIDGLQGLRTLKITDPQREQAFITRASHGRRALTKRRGAHRVPYFTDDIVDASIMK